MGWYKVGSEMPVFSEEKLAPHGGERAEKGNSFRDFYNGHGPPRRAGWPEKREWGRKFVLKAKTIEAALAELSDCVGRGVDQSTMGIGLGPRDLRIGAEEHHLKRPLISGDRGVTRPSPAQALWPMTESVCG